MEAREKEGALEKRREALEDEMGCEGEPYRIALSFDPDDDPSPLFDYGFHLAELLKGEVIVVHALEHIVSTDTSKEEEKIHRLVEEIIASLREEWKRIPHRVEIIYGKEIDSFVHFVEREKIDLFGFYYYRKLLGKSLSEQFIRYLTNCSLLVVKDKMEFRPVKKVLVPLDFSDSSFKQKEFILRLKACAPYPIKVVFLHVLNGETDGAQEEEVKLLFGELFDNLGELKIAYGDAAEVILHELQKGDYNLVVIGRTGRGLNLECGKVTEAVIKGAPCPVVVV